MRAGSRLSEFDRPAGATGLGSAGVLPVIDQGVNSLTNIVGVVIVAHACGLREFGVFATLQLVVTLVQWTCLAGFGERLLQDTGPSRLARFHGGMTVLVVVELGAAAAAALSLLAGNPNAIVFAAFTAPALCGLDYVRTMCWASSRAARALVMDLTFGVIQIAALLLITSHHGWNTAGWAWLAWGGAAAITFLGWAVLLVPPGRGLWRGSFRLQYGFEMLVVNGALQVAQLVVSPHLGVEFNGLYRATLIPFGPLIVLAQAARAILIPRLRTGQPGARRVLTASLGAFTALTVLCTLACVVAAETHAFRAVLGGVSPSVPMILWTGLVSESLGAYLVFYYLLRAREADRAVRNGRLAILVTVVATIAVTLQAGSGNTFLAMTALTWTVGLLVMMISARRSTGTTTSVSHLARHRARFRASTSPSG